MSEQAPEFSWMIWVWIDKLMIREKENKVWSFAAHLSEFMRP
jgi:hypothetical protein